MTRDTLTPYSHKTSARSFSQESGAIGSSASLRFCRFLVKVPDAAGLTTIAKTLGDYSIPRRCR
jgi:hypothetical protein